MGQTLWAVSDLHAAVKRNLAVIDDITPNDPSDWLIVAGDVAERTDVILKVLNRLRKRFAKVIWVPGNHELFASADEPHKGREKYELLVDGCRRIDVLTPEDPYPVFGDVTVVPLFTLYDYSFRPPGSTVEQAISAAHERGVVLTDEFSIAPFVDIRAWCWDRLAYSVNRLSRVSGPTILVNHWPLLVEPTQQMYYPEIALWCGTRHTRTWPQRYNAQQVIFGHLHIPGTTVVDGVAHHEVSLGYPREWRNNLQGREWPVPILEVGNA